MTSLLAQTLGSDAAHAGHKAGSDKGSASGSKSATSDRKGEADAARDDGD